MSAVTELVLTRIAARRVRGVLVPRVRPVWGARRARSAADFIDALVDSELELLAMLPVHRRTKPAEVLTVLVILANSYRAFGRNEIDKVELRSREHQTSRLLSVLHQQERGGRSVAA